MFNLYSKIIRKKLLIVYNIKYTIIYTYTAVLSDTLEELLHLVERLNLKYNNYNSKVNHKNLDSIIADLVIDSTEIEKASSHKYLDA